MTPDAAALSVIIELRIRIAELEADVADLRKHLDTCPANQEEPDARH